MAETALPAADQPRTCRHALTTKANLPTLRTFLLFALMALASIDFWFSIRAKPPTPNDHLDEVFRPLAQDAVPCSLSSTPAPLKVLVLGQSNAGNHGQRPSLPDAEEATYLFQGTCYRTTGPAPGATGRQGNPWPLLGKALSRLTGRPVVFSVFAVESTDIRQWAEPGNLNHRLIEMLASNRASSFTPDIVIWQQGEADAIAGTHRTDYRRRFTSLVATLRSNGVQAPVIAALSTRCRNSGGEQIRAALVEVAQDTPGVRLGPDSDKLAGPYRINDCHFSDSGLAALADLWLKAIAPTLEATPAP